MKKILNKVMIAVFVISFFGLFIVNLRIKDKCTDAKQKLITQKMEQDSLALLYKTFLELSIETNGNHLPSIILSDITEISGRIQNLLIFFIGQTNCHICTDKTAQILKSFGEKIGYDNILILGEVANKRMLDVFCLSNKLDSIKILNINPGNLKLKVENISRPVFFTIDKNGRIDNTFVIEKILPYFTISYLEAICLKLKTGTDSIFAYKSIDNEIKWTMPVKKFKGNYFMKTKKYESFKIPLNRSKSKDSLDYMY